MTHTEYLHYDILILKYLGASILHAQHGRSFLYNDVSKNQRNKQYNLNPNIQKLGLII